MFTGLIERVGKIVRIQPLAPGKKFLISPGKDFETAAGDSVAVDGTCFTVTGRQGDSFWVEVSPESLSRSTIGKQRIGGKVNLERPLRPSDRLGGHFVLGHVDGIGSIKKLAKPAGFLEIEIEAERDLEKYLVEKGSIAVDGISLTINKVKGPVFSLMLIPETLKRTTLAEKKIGDPVNLETDIIGKYVERFLSRDRQGLTKERLREEGF